MKVFKANNSKMEKKLQESAEEINRGNSILEKYTKEIESQKEKIKKNKLVMLNQEKKVKELEKQLQARAGA